MTQEAVGGREKSGKMRGRHGDVRGREEHSLKADWAMVFVISMQMHLELQHGSLAYEIPLAAARGATGLRVGVRIYNKSE